MAPAQERLQERRFDPAFLAELRDRTPMAELVGRNVALRRSGRTQVGCCPFHGERTPSFHVYKDHFHCYGCGARGDAIGFVQQRDRVSFPDAVFRLAAEAGMDLPGAKPPPSTPGERTRQEAAVGERSRQSEARRAAAERADAVREAFIARKAAAIWAKSPPAPADHPYLARKRVEPHDLRVDRKGNLLVPLRDDDGRLWNLQTISADGDKRTLWRKTPSGLEGGRTKGLHYTIGSLDGAPAAAVATGYATSASIRADTGLPTRMAFSDGNLLPVVRGLRERHPELPILLGADNDHHAPRKHPPRVNQGLAKAEEAAAAVGGIADYGTARVKLNEGLAARRMDAAVLDKQFGELDREIGQAAETLPGRKSGQSAYDELAAKAKKLAEFFADVIERAKNAIRPAEAPGQAPGQAPAPKAAPAPSMAI